MRISQVATDEAKIYPTVIETARPHVPPKLRPVLIERPRPSRPSQVVRPAAVTPHLSSRDRVSPATALHPQPGNSAAGPPRPGDGRSDLGAGPPGPIATAVPTPLPIETARPSCANRHADARAIEKVTPEVPAIAAEAHLSGTVAVKVTLSADAAVLGITIYQSSGSAALDNAALDAARRSTYAAEIQDCQQVPGSYLYYVEFSS